MSDAARVFNIQRYSIHDGPGIRTVIFFKGCSLNCLWCSNPESISAPPLVFYNRALCGMCGACESVCPSGAVAAHDDFGRDVDKHLCTLCGRCVAACPSGALKVVGREYGIDELLAEAKKDRPFYTQSGGGVTLSGGEPLLQSEVAAALLARLVGAAIHTAVETAGNVPREAVERVLPHTDLFLYDVKHVDSERHRRLTGHGNERILGNLSYIGEVGVPVLLRMPVIPGCNDSPDDIARVAGVASRIRGLQGVELLPYHDYGINKHAASGRQYGLRDVRPPAAEHMQGLRAMLSERLDVPVIYSE